MTKIASRRASLAASTILAAGLVLVAVPAHAQSLPDTGNVSSVTAGLGGGAPGSTNPTFTTTGVPGAQTLQVDLKDNRTILTWGGTGFNIAAGNTVDFKDARAASGVTGRTDNIAVLNRDLNSTGNVSNISGTLRSDANVAVYVINKGGVYFGGTASVDTGSFFASASDLSNDNDFLNAATTLRFAQYQSGRAVGTNPGARFKTTASTSTNGGRMGDLVFIGSIVTHNDNVISTVGGDAALIAATDVTVLSAPGSPLSFTINRGTDVTNASEIVYVGGALTAGNVVVAGVNASSAIRDALVRVNGTLSATGAVVTDRGVVLTAGNSAAGVTVAPTNYLHGILAGTGTINSASNIYFGTSAPTAGSSTISGTINATKLLDVTGATNFGPSSGSAVTGSITAAMIAIHGSVGFSYNPVKTTTGDLTFDGTASISANASFDIAGSLTGTGATFIHVGSTVNVGGQISVVTTGPQTWSSDTTAVGPIYLESGTSFNPISIGSNTIRSGSDVTIRAPGNILVSGTLDAGGRIDVRSSAQVRVNSAIGAHGVRLMANANGGFTSSNLLVGTISAPGSDADVTLSGFDIQKISDIGTGLTTAYSLTAGRDIFITTTKVGQSFLIDTLIAARSANVTMVSIEGTRIEGSSGTVTLRASNSVNVGELVAGTDVDVAATNAVVIGNARAMLGNLTFASTAGAILLGSTNSASSFTAGANFTATTPGAVQLRGSATIGGDLNATGNTVILGTAGFLGNQIKAAGAINLTSTTFSVQVNGNASVQSNSDGIGTEAITVSAATNATFSAGSSLLAGTNRQSDIRIRSGATNSVTLSNLSARSLLGATGTDPFTNGLVRNAPISLRGQVNLINTLSLQATGIPIVGAATVTAGDIDLRASSAISIDAALTASGDVGVRTSSGTLTVGTGGSVGGRDIVLSTPDAFVNNGGAGVLAASGHWVVYSADPSGDTFGGLDSGNTAIWGSTLATRDPSTIAGNRYVFALTPTLTFTAAGLSKVYGTQLTSAATPFTVTGYQPGVAGAFLADSAATAYSGAPIVDSAGFAARAPVAGSPYAITITAGTLRSDTGYALAFGPNGAITVTPKGLTATVTANNKTYDGTTTASGTILLNGIVAGDTVGTSGATYAFADKNAGTGKTVTVTGATLTGADAGNYTLIIPAGIVADIFKKAITAGIVANNKTYDGTTTGTGAVTLNGAVSGDAVAATGTTFTFADKNAGVGKNVAVAGTALTGADAGNYTLTVSASAVADILKAALTANVVANSKVYDGTTTASGSITLNGVVAGDSVGTTGATFVFADKNAGTGKTVNVAGATLTGADAGNYTVSIPATVLADILKKAITATAVANNKTYDGTTAGSGTVALNGVIAGDAVTAGGTTFTFADKNAGTGKTVSITGTVLSGADAGNYALSVPASVIADILKKAITGAAVANSKTYDGTTTGTGAVTLTGLIAGDAVTATGTSFTFADKNVGTSKNVAVAGTTLSGADAGNYTLTIPASVFADILKKTLSATVAVNSKVYDGTTAGTGTVTLNGVVAGDAVSLTSTTFTFADKNAGTGKAVGLAGTALSGADAGNYAFTVPTNATGTITPRPLAIAANNASKTQGEADPVLTYTLGSGSLVSGDTLLGLLARSSGEAPGTYAIGQGTLSAGSNYLITFTSGTFTIALNPANAQQQTLRAIALPAQVQAPQTSATGDATLRKEDLCGDDRQCVAR